jgi:hypothetical protein
MALSVPIPILSQEDSSGNEFLAAKPFNLSCGPVLFADGTLLTPENVLEFAFLIYRETQAGTIEAWKEETGTWTSQLPPPNPQSLFSADGQWQSILIGIGQQDKASGQPKFATDHTTHYPKYSAKCFFKGRNSSKTEESGESVGSQSVEIIAVGETDRAGLSITPEPAQQATHISLFLKDASLSERGRILIEEQSSGFVVELKANNASVKITGQGGIVLTPAAGAALQLGGDLTVTGNLSLNGNLSVVGLVNGTTIP